MRGIEAIEEDKGESRRVRNIWFSANNDGWGGTLSRGISWGCRTAVLALERAVAPDAVMRDGVVSLGHGMKEGSGVRCGAALLRMMQRHKIVTFWIFRTRQHRSRGILGRHEKVVAFKRLFASASHFVARGDVR